MNERALAWTMLYGSVLGIAHHPRAREANKTMRPDEAARIADDALIEWEKRFARPDVTAPTPQRLSSAA